MKPIAFGIVGMFVGALVMTVFFRALFALAGAEMGPIAREFCMICSFIAGLAGGGITAAHQFGAFK